MSQRKKLFPLLQTAMEYDELIGLSIMARTNTRLAWRRETI